MVTRTPPEFTSRRDRWQAAPETTFRETEYIDKLSKNKTPVVVKLIDGEEVRGWIEYYDKDIIRITRNVLPNLFIYKSRVKYRKEPGKHEASVASLNYLCICSGGTGRLHCHSSFTMNERCSSNSTPLRSQQMQR
jgi:host factor-I protein